MCHSLDDIHDFWKNPSKGNQPSRYLKHTKRSKFLYEYVNKYVGKDAKILEPGCNVGRNLNYLYEKGYEQLTGVEINEEAVELLSKQYPNLAEKANIYLETIEERVKQFENDEFDLTFSMAVFEHLHPSSDWVFEEIARITKSFIITIEAEKWSSDRHFPRNYKKLFKQYGFKQIDMNKNCDEIGVKYICRVLQKQ
ncbi:class I SAM-dependent methyltransferase [Alkalibacillus silvisoli]|uniref:Class I SAM-dependent methyltransferase n=1 Tax=Alkalibacillus silvisoli TaxID=392823 RepID=A0ABN0ZNQ5_9BACI